MADPAEGDTGAKNGDEESLFYADANGVDRLIKTIETFAQDVCKAQHLPIKIDEFICSEVHTRAKETLAFHRTLEYSVYKEVAHIGFWINRLKPIRIDSPMNAFRLLHAAAQALNQWTFGAWTSLEKEAASVEDGLRDKLDFPVNEHIVVSMIIDLIEAAQITHANTLKTKAKNDFLETIADNKERVPWLRKRLERTLRDHTHSARGFAMLVETTFRTRCEQY